MGNTSAELHILELIYLVSSNCNTIWWIDFGVTQPLISQRKMVFSLSLTFDKLTLELTEDWVISLNSSLVFRASLEIWPWNIFFFAYFCRSRDSTIHFLWICYRIAENYIFYSRSHWWQQWQRERPFSVYHRGNCWRDTSRIRDRCTIVRLPFGQGTSQVSKAKAAAILVSRETCRTVLKH